MKVKALCVKNYGPFITKQAFKFRPGISVIYGLNQTSGRYSKNSNWVGKSLFFNSLSELLYDEPIVGLKQDKMKSGSRALILEKEDGTTIQVVKTSGKRESVKILENGTPLEHLTKTKANEYIASQWGVSRSEFETFIHLDSRVPHPLVMGSSTDRKHFFDDFFKLDRIDAERKLYLRELRKLSETKAAFNELKQSYKLQSKQVLEDSDYEELSQQLESLRSERARLDALVDEYQQYQKLKVTYDSFSSRLKELPCELSEVSTHIEILSERKGKIERTKKQALRYSLYLQQKQEYENLVSELSPLAKKCSREKLHKGAIFYERAKAKHVTVSSQLNHLEEPDEVEKCDPIEGSLEDLLGKRASLKHQIEHAEKFKSGVCPTCGQPVDTVNVKTLKKEFAQVTETIAQLKAYDAYCVYKEQREQYVGKKNEFESQLQELTQKVKKFKPYYEAYHEVADLPQEPEPVKEPKYTTEELDRKLQVVSKQLTTLSAVEPYVSDLQKYLTWSGVKEFDYTTYNQVGENIARIEAKLTVNAEARKALSTMTDRLRELNSQLKEEPYVKALVEIFSDKTMKKTMVTQISATLCSLLNKYAKVVFDQDYKFNLLWDTQLQLLCTRKVGSQELTSDVRKLSGAESKLFTLILILSLLSFVPPKRRPSIMILDEPTANFSAETTQAFMRLLDVLKTVIPSIVIITPRDDVYPDSRPYTVVRTKKGSTIVEGLPNDVLASGH